MAYSLDGGGPTRESQGRPKLQAKVMSKFDPTDRFREIFRHFGELFNQLIESIPGSSGSFLWLDPHKPAIQFFGVGAQSTSELPPEESAEEFRVKVKGLIGNTPPHGHEALFETARRLASLDGYSFAEAYQGAVDLLHLNPFPPGNAYQSQPEGDSGPGKLIAIPHWCLDTQGDSQPKLRPLTHFQDVLDLAALYKFNLEEMQAKRVESEAYEIISSREGRPSVVVVVRNYAARQDLVTVENAPMYVAEHVQTLGSTLLDAKNKEWVPGLTCAIDEYFMPMRGLGQWRAAFECKVLKASEPDPISVSILEQLTDIGRLGFEELFTRALINAFAHLLLDTETETPEDLLQAFATLWWAREIRFWHRSEEGGGTSWRLVYPLRWCPREKRLTLFSAGSSDPDRPNLPPNFYGGSHSGWFSAERRSPAESQSLCLDLNKLKTEDHEQRRDFSRRWGFDFVEFTCDLVDATDRELHRWAEILGDELLQVRTRIFQAGRIKEAEIRTARAQAEYSTALFAFGHHVGKLFQESGLAGLRPEIYQAADPAENLRLARMKRRLMIAWGVGEATRPLRYGGRGYPPPWFPSTPRSVDPEALARNLEHLCQYYLSALIHRLPFDWKIEWIVGGEPPKEQTLEQLAETAFRPLPSLPPFDDKNPQQPATVAISLGLAEQLRNLRQHWISNMKDLMKGFKGGNLARLASIRIEVESVSKICLIKTESMTYFRKQRELDDNRRIYSRSIEQIRDLEARALSIDGDRIVETEQPVYMDHHEKRFRRVRTIWIYDYGKVKRAPDQERGGE
jgi:hypothetical protein